MDEQQQDWGHVEHTFTTGRKATIRPELKMVALYRLAVADEQPELVDRLQEMEKGELQDPAAAFPVQDLILRTMFVRPRVLASGEETAEGEITVDDLSDSEILEITGIAMGGLANARRFLGGGDGSGAGADGADVASPAKPTLGPASRKRRRVPA